jgi:hypothetical protein
MTYEELKAEITRLCGEYYTYSLYTSWRPSGYADCWCYLSRKLDGSELKGGDNYESHTYEKLVAKIAKAIASDGPLTLHWQIEDVPENTEA